MNKCVTNPEQPSGRTIGTQTRHSTKSKAAMPVYKTAMEERITVLTSGLVENQVTQAERVPTNTIRARLTAKGVGLMNRPGDNGIGHIPMFADKESLVFQRRNSHVSEVVSGGGGSKDHQFVGPVIGDMLPRRALARIAQQFLESLTGKVRIVHLHGPVNIERAIVVERNDASHSVGGLQHDAVPVGFNQRVFQVKTQRLRRQRDAQAPRRVSV